MNSNFPPSNENIGSGNARRERLLREGPVWMVVFNVIMILSVSLSLLSSMRPGRPFEANFKGSAETVIFPEKEKSSSDEPGYPISFSVNVSVAAGNLANIETGLTFSFPRKDQMGLVTPQEGWTDKGIVILGSSVEGKEKDLTITLVNFSNVEVIVPKGEIIARMIFFNVPKTLCLRRWQEGGKGAPWRGIVSVHGNCRHR